MSLPTSTTGTNGRDADRTGSLCALPVDVLRVDGSAGVCGRWRFSRLLAGSTRSVQSGRVASTKIPTNRTFVSPPSTGESVIFYNFFIELMPAY